MALLLLSLPFFAVSALTGWRWTVLLPLVVWPLYVLGLAQDWWGYGFGDAWQLGLVILIATSIAATALGLVTHAAVAALRSRRRRDGAATA